MKSDRATNQAIPTQPILLPRAADYQHPAAEPASAEVPDGSFCPNCGRADALIILEDYFACAACGFSSDGLRGCT